MFHNSHLYILHGLTDVAVTARTGALYQATHISSDFDNEVETIERTFLNVGYSKHFIPHTEK